MKNYWLNFMLDLTKILELVLGNRVTTQRGIYSGIFSGFLVTVLVVSYFAFLGSDIDLLSIISYEDLDFWGKYGIWYMVACVSIGFIMMGGRAIGWLFTRPFATILREAFPRVDHTLIWTFSSALVWTSLALLITKPLQNQTDFWGWFSFFVITILACIAGILGGRVGAGISGGPYRDSRELVAIGGTVTGSLVVGVQTLMDLFFAYP